MLNRFQSFKNVMGLDSSSSPFSLWVWTQAFSTKVTPLTCSLSVKISLRLIWPIISGPDSFFFNVSFEFLWRMRVSERMSFILDLSRQRSAAKPVRNDSLQNAYKMGLTQLLAYERIFAIMCASRIENDPFSAPKICARNTNWMGSQQMAKTKTTTMTKRVARFLLLKDSIDLDIRNARPQSNCFMRKL